MNSYLVVLACALVSIRAIPIDNGLVGDPEVQCGPNSVTINFNTENSFEGNVYVKNYFGDEQCKTKGDNSRLAGIELNFETCGVKRERSLEPRGVFVWTTVIISFHPVFLTKIDRAIRVQCFYMEADKTVSQELEVSMLTTVLQTLTVPMPVCRYDILDGGPGGDPVRFTIIGQQVYHKWTCDTDTTDTFCMVVYDCKVDDGSGDLIQLLDDDGCALDKYLLGNLEYPTDLMAGREAHVFKYADRANLYFNCQIRITIKEPGEECARPQCPSLRKRRSTQTQQNAAVMDVSTPHALLVADVDLTEDDVPSHLIHPHHTKTNSQVYLRESPRVVEQGYCMSQSSLALIIAVFAFLLLATAVTALLMFSRRTKA